jgi:hypothetical protein
MMNNRPHLHRPQLDLRRNQERIPLASALIAGSVKIAFVERLPYGRERCRNLMWGTLSRLESEVHSDVILVVPLWLRSASGCRRETPRSQ